MRTVFSVLCAILLPAAASAQPRAYAVWERPAAGIFLGPSSNGDQNSGGAGGEISFVFDTPTVFGYRLRADVSRVAWRFEDRDFRDVLVTRDVVTLKSIRLSALRVRHAGPRAAGYAGGGYGVYRYEYAAAPLRRPWRGGLHGVAGLEFTTASQRYAIDGEVRVHAINGTGRSPVFSVTLLKADLAIGMKVRF
jgi:hypothetical protein